MLFCSRDLIKSLSIVCPKRGAYFNEQNSCVRRASCASPQGYVGIQHQATLLTASFRFAVILKFKGLTRFTNYNTKLSSEQNVKDT